MGYLIFRNVDTRQIGGQDGTVYVAQMPSHKKAAMRRTEYYVDGRDGALHRDEGYSNFSMTCRLLVLHGTPFIRQKINAWADGTGNLITSDDLSRCYRASVQDEVRFTRAVYNGEVCDEAEITFVCQPYMYEAVPEVKHFPADGNTIINATSATALPLIVVNGAGDCQLNIAGQDITIIGARANVPVSIDCETGYIWSATGAMSMRGEFPELGIGSNNVTLGTGVTSVDITPRWRWI